MDSHYEIPFKVKQLLYWQDRYWAIDESGTLRWSEKYCLDKWYTESKDGKYRTTDAGWWEIPGEPIIKICVSKKGLLVTTGESLYRFTGDSIETYSMNRIGDRSTEERWYGRYIEGVGIVLMSKEDWDKSKEAGDTDGQ